MWRRWFSEAWDCGRNCLARRSEHSPGVERIIVAAFEYAKKYQRTASYDGRQIQRSALWWRSLATRFQRSGSGIPGYHCESPVCRRDGDVHGSRSITVRRHCQQQSVWRHPDGSGRGNSGRAWSCRLRQHSSWPGFAFRTSSRQRTTTGGKRNCESNRSYSDFSDDVRISRFPDRSEAIEVAVRDAVSANETTTDLGGNLSTEQAASAIITRLGKQ